MNGPEWLEALRTWSETWIKLPALPRTVIAFLLIIAGGYALALVCRALTRRLTIRVSQLLARLGRTSVPADVDQLAQAVAASVFWLILILTGMTATEFLGLPVVTSWLSRVASYVPRLVVAIFIVAVGVIGARIARRIVTTAARGARLPAPERAGKLTEIALSIGIALVAIEQLGIEISLLKTVILIVLAALLGGAALAFGLGARELVSNVLSAHFVNRFYQVGQTIRVQDIQGRIVRITETAVIIEATDGEVLLPARELTAGRSTLVLKDDTQKGRSS